MRIRKEPGSNSSARERFEHRRKQWARDLEKLKGEGPGFLIAFAKTTNHSQDHIITFKMILTES